MIDPKPSPLSPGALLRGVHVTSPIGPLSVAGVVEKAHPYERSVYLLLSGDQGVIEARVPREEQPPLKTAVVITGMVNVRPDGLGKGLNVIVHGHVDGAAQRSVRPIISLHKARRVTLESLMADPTTRVADLAVVGTERAFSDIAGRVLGVPPLFRVVSTINEQAILAAASAAAADGSKAVIFARGGSADATEDLWDDAEFVAKLIALPVPFYTAIGHSDRMHLADIFADQSFATPTHIGTEIQTIGERRAARSRELAELSALRSETARLRRSVSNLEHAAKIAAAPTPLERDRRPKRRLHVQLSPQAWALVIAIVLVAIAISPVFRR